MIDDKEFIALKNRMDRIYEDSQILAGTRNQNSKPKAAIRREDLASLSTIVINSNPVTASPTQAEFNTLVADVQAIANILATIARSLQ